MQIDHQRLYQKLGCLFYAIADADAHIRKSEEKALQEYLNFVWLPFESKTDEFGTNCAQHIFIVFDYLHAEGASPEAAFHDFTSYYHEHKASFDAAVKSKILQTAEAIAKASYGKNEQELRYFQQLQELLKT